MERIRSFSPNNNQAGNQAPRSGAPTPSGPSEPPRGPAPHPTPHLAGPSLASKILVILLIVASLVFIANMTLQLAGKRGSTPLSTGSAAVDEAGYQAIFLTNGQVYFGKLDDVNSQYVKVTDIYYLQVQQADGKKLQEGDNNADPKISLAKLGGELHGPQDTMYISRDQVLFWENLQGKDKSKVVEAIEKYKADNK
jgi:hypothetical protein